MAQLEELDISSAEWEVSHSSADGIEVPIMEEYPNPENTFDIFMGTNGDTTGVDPEAIAGAVATVGAVAGELIQNRDETKQQLRNRCGRRPLLRKNRGEYDKCREEFYKEIQGTSIRTAPTTSTPPPPPPPKGMSTGAKVGIALGVIAVIGVGAYFIFKKK